MGTKKITDKKFIVTAGFPGAPKGTIVYYINEHWVYAQTSKPCPFSPSKFPEYFSVLVPTKYNIDDIVHFNENYFKGHTNCVTGKIVEVLPKTKTVQRYKVEVANSTSKVTVTVNETDLANYGTYYFVSSKGIIHQVIEYPSHVITFAYRLRISTGNYFQTKDLAQSKLNAINSMAIGNKNIK